MAAPGIGEVNCIGVRWGSNGNGYFYLGQWDKEHLT